MRDEFAAGLTYWWRGWKHLWGSKARAYVIMPFILSFAFFVSAIWSVLHFTPGFVASALKMVFSGHLRTLSAVLYYPMWITFFILSLVVIVYLTYLVQIVICGPFYSVLADRTLRDLGKGGEGFQLSLRVMVASMIKAGIFFILGAGLFIFSFVPLVNIIGLVAALLILAFDSMDYTFEAMGFGLRERTAYFGRHVPQWLGMAASLALTLVIPGLTLLILPGAVVGAAMIFEHEGQKKDKRAG